MKVLKLSNKKLLTLCNNDGKKIVARQQLEDIFVEMVFFIFLELQNF